MPREGNLEDELGRVQNVEPPKDRAKSSGPSGSQAVKELKPRLEKFFKEVLAPIVGVADEYDGRIIEKKSGQLATAYATLAGESPLVRRFIYAALSTGGPLAAAMFVTASVTLPILHHHGVIQLPENLGVPLIGEKLEEPKPPPPQQPSTPTSGENGSGSDSEAFAQHPPPAV